MRLITSAPRLAALIALNLGLACPARADDVSLADLKVATRALGFLQNLPPNDQFRVGVIYVASSAASKILGEQAAERLRTLPGPKNTNLKAETLTAGELASRGDSFDALYLLPGANDGVIAEIARRKHLLVMSDDPACLDKHCCMLMARDTGRVEIILDEALAQSAGVSFSSVFAMMVKHK